MIESGKGYVVIGATAAPGRDELPQFLDPVCRAPDQDEIYFVANVEPWDGSAPGFYPVPRQSFDEECDAGYWQRLEPGFSFAWDHHLVALDADRPPFYLPAHDAELVLRSRGEEALAAVAEDLERGITSDWFDERVWYAMRALPKDPFPLLAFIALMRGRLVTSLLNEFESELPLEYRDPSPLHRRAQEQHWQALLKKIHKDPVGSRVMTTVGGSATKHASWLDPFKNLDSFLSTMLGEFGDTPGQACHST